MPDFTNPNRVLFFKGAERHALLAANSMLRQFFSDVHGAYPLIDMLTIPEVVDEAVNISFSFSVYGDAYIARAVLSENEALWPKKGVVMVTKVKKWEQPVNFYFTLFGEPEFPKIWFAPQPQS